MRTIMTREHFIVRFRWPIIIGCVALSALMGLQLFRIAIDADPMSLLPETMPSRKNTAAIEKIFGPGDMLFFIVETGDVLAPETLRRIERLSTALGQVAGVEKVLSLFDTKEIRGEDGAMIVEPAVARIPETPDEREALRQRLRENELAYELVVSRDFCMAAIMLSLAEGVDKNQVYREASAVVAAVPGTETVHAGGQPVFETVITREISRDIIILIPIALLLIIAVLYGFFRQFRGIALPFGVVLLSTVFGVGLLPLIGWKITVLSAILPLMVVAFSNNYGIYLVSRYQELGRAPGPHTASSLAAETFRGLWQPILFSGLTTMVGILGLLAHIMVPARQIGVAAALAIGFSLVASLLGIPAALSLLRVRTGLFRDNPERQPFLGRGLAFMARYLTAHPKMVLVATVVVAGLAAASALRVSVDANQENLFPENHPVAIGTRIINQHFGGAHTMSLLYEGDIKDPALLGDMARMKNELARFPGVGQVASIAEVLRIMSTALSDRGDPAYNAIPATREGVAQYLELYAMSGDPSDFEKLVDFNYKKAQLIVRIKDGTTASIHAIEKRIRELVSGNPAITTIGGYAAVFTELAVTLIKGQITSIACAFAVIVLLVMVQFRSVSAGVVAGIPLLFSMLAGFGVMGVTGIKLDIATAMITSIVLGCGVDFSIQFLWKFRGLRQQGRGMAAAIGETMISTGRTIAFNAVCISSGFCALFFSSLPPLRAFALLFMVLTVTCMIVTLIVIPAVCLVFKPRFCNPPVVVKPDA